MAHAGLDDTLSAMSFSGRVRCTLVALSVSILPPAVLGNSLSVTPDAAMDGTDFGLQVDLDGQKNLAYVVNRTGDQGTLTTEFWLDATNATLSKKRLLVVGAYSFVGSFHPVFEVEVAQKGNGKPAVKFFCRENNGNAVFVGARQINRPVRVEVDFVAASSPGAKDGICRIRVDGKTRGQKTALSNGEQSVSSVRVGVLRGRKWSSLSGSLYLDEYVAKR